MKTVRSVVRQIVPLLALPLCVLASIFAAAPWLRSFPVSLAGAPLYGAAVLSVLVPMLTVRFRPSWLWFSVLLDIVIFVFFTLFVVLQEPLGFGDLATGLYRGPSQVLTFALPLVSPRNLMVAPVAIIWAAGALAGECLARRWYTLLPYVGFLVAFGLAYAGTQRAAGSELGSARYRETVLAALLLVVLLIMRVAQAWVRQDETAESTQPDGILPLRGLVIGTVTTLVVALGAALVVQASAFPKRSTAPQRVPSINDSKPLTPMSFIAGLRPRTGKDAAQPVFTVTVDKSVPGYFPIANVDYYDGSGWSFDRIFRPSGGVLPPDTDTALATKRVVMQQYRIASGPLTSAPWMPFVYRPQKVTGTSVNIDPASGMIVPAGELTGGETYTVRSGVPTDTFDHVKARLASPDTGTPSNDVELPPGLRTTLDQLVKTFSAETGVPSSPALPFLQALQKDLQNHYALSRAAQGSATSTLTPSPTPSAKPSSHASTTPKSTDASKPKSAAKSRHDHAHAAQVHPLLAKPTPSHHAKHQHTQQHKTHPAQHSSSNHPTSSPSSPTPTVSNTGPAADLAGGAGFSDVLASILGGRTGTPEQYATLVALVARDLGVPARVVTGFRVHATTGSDDLGPGEYDVTTTDAWTWVEIPLLGDGWVILDATPGQYAPGNQQTESASAPPPSSSAPRSQNALVTQSNGGHGVLKKTKVPAAASTSHHALLIALVVVAIVLLLALLLVLLSRKPVRAARRRRAMDPRQRVVGAWRESIDVLTESGLPELNNLTSGEIAALAAERFGPDSGRGAAAIGAAANAVAYSSTTLITPDDADAAWAEQRALRRSVRRTLGMRDRVAAGVRYHRTKRTPLPTSPPSWAAAAATARATGGGQHGRHRSPDRHRAH
jgi:hypothetical protein